jgi:hypothetical protein
MQVINIEYKVQANNYREEGISGFTLHVSLAKTIIKEKVTHDSFCLRWNS